MNQKEKIKKNFTALKNICYLELRLSEYDTKKILPISNTNENIKQIKNQKKVINKKCKYQFGIKINSIRKYLNIKSIDLKGKQISPSFLNVLLIPNSNFCVLISSDCKLLIIKIENNIKDLKKIILEPKFYSSIYKLSSLNENSFSLLYTSGSFDLFFIDTDKENNKIKLNRKKYINNENSTNIINQILLSKEDNIIIVLIKDKINFYKYNEKETIILIKQILRNNITLILYLNFHNSVLTLYNTQEIIIKDELEKNNYIIDIKNKQINKILELKSFNYLAITHFNSDIDIFDLNVMILKIKLKGHKKIVNDLKELIPSENSNYNPKLISCSDDKTIRIWDSIKFYCEKIISIEKSSFMFFLNILPNKEIIVLDNENVIHMIE